MNGMTLTIKGLFGHFNYEIPLYGLDNADGIPMSSGVTILTGPNGYGKTTILRMLEAISKGDSGFFANLKFEELSVRFEEKTDELVIQKKQSIVFEKPSAFPTTFMIQEQRLLELREFWEEVKPTRGSILELLTSVSAPNIPIQKQKLVNTVTEVPVKLKGHISEVSDNYLKTDAKLTASLITRIVNQSEDIDFTQSEFDRLYQDMNNKLRTLQENGFSEFAQQDIPAFHAKKAGVLRVFFDDFNERYGIYEPLINKLTLFRKILNRRFKDFKRVEISREYGLRVRDIQTGENGDIIPLEKLSSGEQETLVLYYQLIFDTEPGTMLLIDEPEISLHIEWQMTFIDELKEIVRLNNLQAVVATHSESILDANWDIQVDLGALYQDERGKLHQ